MGARAATPRRLLREAPRSRAVRRRGEEAVPAGHPAEGLLQASERVTFDWLAVGEDHLVDGPGEQGVGSEDVGSTSCCIRLAPCCIHAAGRFLPHRFMRDLARHVVCKSGQRRR